MGELLESSGNAAGSATFGDVRFEPQAGELHRAGRVAKLTPKAAAVLAALIEQAPALVTKEQLLARVWGGRAVGDEALTSCVLELRRALDDDARRPRYIETRHRRGYRLVAALAPVATAQPAASQSQATPISFKPSLAVLPFDSFSADPDQEYFADGVVEDITTALSRVGLFFVVARNSAFTFKGRRLQAQEIGRQLGVRYLVEGSLQRAGRRLRMTAQLIDADTGHHLWADRYDGEASDVFDLQDRIVSSVVGAISPSVRDAEIRRARLKRPESLQAYDYVLRAYPGWRLMEDPDHEEAIALFHKAFELEPGYAHAMALAAWAHGQRFGRVMAGNAEDHRRQAIDLANAALALAPDDPSVLLGAAHALLHAADPQDMARCELIIAKALTLDPNSASGWMRKGYLHVARSQPAEAIEAFERSTRLSPLDPQQAYSRFGIGDAHFIAGRLDEALAFYRRCLAERPRDPAFRRRMYALLALVGEVEEAQRLTKSLLADHPHFTLEQIAHAKPFESPHLERYLEGLLRAGFS